MSNPLARQGHQPPRLSGQAAQGPIQPGLDHLQGWTGHPQPLWAAVPAPHHSPGKELPPNIQPKSSLFQLKGHILSCYTSGSGQLRISIHHIKHFLKPVIKAERCSQVNGDASPMRHGHGILQSVWLAWNNGHANHYTCDASC